jgi:hypothetical protein
MAPNCAESTLLPEDVFSVNNEGSRRMNLTVATVSTTWKRLKLQYVSLACGLGLAVAAAISAGALDQDRSSPLVTGSQPISSSSPGTSRHAEPGSVIAYIVDSQEQAASIERDANQDALLVVSSGSPLSNVTRYYFDSASPDVDKRVSDLSWDLWASGINSSFEVVDLRQGQANADAGR